MSVITEDRDAIDALRFYEWDQLDVGLLQLELTSVVVIPREQYVSLTKSVLNNYEEDLPDSLLDDLIHTAETAERFALGEWVDDTRGCGCLIGEYLVASREIGEHNDDVLVRRAKLSRDSSSDSIEKRLRRNHGEVAGVLIEIGTEMDCSVRRHLEVETGCATPDYGTVFIRDEVVA